MDLTPTLLAMSSIKGISASYMNIDNTGTTFSIKIFSNYTHNYCIQSCVTPPFTKLIINKMGSPNIIFKQISCTHNSLCWLSNCLNPAMNAKHVFILRIPPAIWLLVNMSQEWKNPWDMVVKNLLNEILHCTMCAIGLIITGMNSLVTTLATTSTATILLTQNIQTTETVNNLCTSTAIAFAIQNDLTKLSCTALVVIQD